ncbi:DinB family protein [Cytobacillus oceanisediminis]|uniref:DinB family protein n=1 Tax=Cytobacillus oceanisediminis TaxID=665099 RepID=UPI0037358472
MSKREFLLDQLAVCRNEDSWIQPLSTALKGLSLEDALWKQNEGSHSIGEIAKHLHFYNERWLKRFREKEVSPPVENPITFSAEGFTEMKWQELVQQLDEGLAEWQQEIEAATESKLHEQIPHFPVDALWWGALSNLCTHNTYHIGQIIYIRKAQGSWKSKE